ncbi:hypothetical protein Glove_137g57 [Diversispora epigaea]|uniref:Uncharacterized protein n=1 Tax=Diversispora epigaea TaxID=1348612 RepID=A0A397IW87_9GLOM|nr:hypothetical protein Glove_137g57 [Diversispora epigaea]
MARTTQLIMMEKSITICASRRAKRSAKFSLTLHTIQQETTTMQEQGLLGCWHKQLLHT